MCVMLFILSYNVLSSYFTQFDGNSHCFNFDIIRDTAPLSSIYPVGVTSPVYRVTVEQLLSGGPLSKRGQGAC